VMLVMLVMLMMLAMGVPRICDILWLPGW